MASNSSRKLRLRAAAGRPKADGDLESAKKTLEDATTIGAGFWVSYIFLMFYIAVSAGAETHVDLFLQNPVKLPFLNLDLPLKAFFFLAPILFVIMHMFTLSKLVILSEKAGRFLEALDMLPKEEAREKLKRQLPSNIFVQFMAGPAELSGGAFGMLLRVMGWMSMAVAPVLLLLLIQLQFLPYHETWMTWEHRILLGLDLGLLWWLWGRVLRISARKSGPFSASWPGLSRPSTSGGCANADRMSGDLSWSLDAFVTWPGVDGRDRPGHDGVVAPAKALARAASHAAAVPLGLAATAAALYASVFVATFPGEPRGEEGSAVARLTKKFDRPDRVFGEEKTQLGLNWPWNTLRLAEFSIYDSLKSDDLQRLEKKTYTISLNGRHLEKADLNRAILGKADFRLAQMQDAALADAQMQGASLDYAQMQGATLLGAQMQGASLAMAKLCRARRSTEPRCKARRSSERRCRARSSSRHRCRAHRSPEPRCKARSLSEHEWRARHSKMRSCGAQIFLMQI